MGLILRKRRVDVRQGVGDLDGVDHQVGELEAPNVEGRLEL